MEKSEPWWRKNKLRVVYPFDKDTCIGCLCKECGSSMKRKFLFKVFPIRKSGGCINHKCEKYYRKLNQK